MYEIEFTPNEAKSYTFGFDLVAEEVGGYTFNKNNLSIDYSPKVYISSIQFNPTTTGGGYRV